MTDPTLSDVLNENQRLYRIVQELTAENKRLREALTELSKLETVVAPDGRRWPVGVFAMKALEKVKK